MFGVCCQVGGSGARRRGRAQTGLKGRSRPKGTGAAGSDEVASCRWSGHSMAATAVPARGSESCRTCSHRVYEEVCSYAQNLTAKRHGVSHVHPFCQSCCCQMPCVNGLYSTLLITLTVMLDIERRHARIGQPTNRHSILDLASCARVLQGSGEGNEVEGLTYPIQVQSLRVYNQAVKYSCSYGASSSHGTGLRVHMSRQL